MQPMPASNLIVSTRFQLFRRASRVGMQIGERSIKINELEKQRNVWTKRKEISIEIPEGIIKNGHVLQPDKLGSIIKDAFQKHAIRNKKISVFVEDIPFFIRHVELPNMPKKEIQQAIDYKARVEFPVQSGDLTIRYYPFTTKQTTIGNAQSYVMIAVNQSFVQQVVDALHTVGLSIASFSLEPVAIYRGLKKQNLLNPVHATTLLVKHDTKRITHSIFQNGKFMYSRSLPSTISQDLLQQEIERTIISWKSTKGNLPIEEVILLGENKFFEGLPELITAYMGVAMQSIEATDLACYGIAHKQPKRLNFYSEQWLHTWRNRTSVYKLAGGFLGLLLTTIVFYQYGTQWVIQHDIAKLRTEIQKNADVERFLQQRRQRNVAYQAALAVQKRIQNENVNPVAVLDLVNRAKPQSIALTQITFANNQLQIAGKAPTQDDVITYLGGLQKDPHLQIVQLTHSEHLMDHVLFTITSKGTLTDGESNHE